jgi:chromosome segregation ATPase
MKGRWLYSVSFSKVRLSRIKESINILDEKNVRLSEVAMKLEELEVRHKVAEIDTNLYSQEAEKLRAEERELTGSVKTLKTNIESLERMLADKKPGEIRDLETKLRSYDSALEKLAEEGRERKEKEKELREHLETLQTRYKLSELSIEEYERKKRELQTVIDEMWS